MPYSIVRFRAGLSCLLALATIIAAALPLAAPQLALAQSAGWNDSVTINSPYSVFEPRVAFDRDGFAHAVFFSGPTQSAWKVYYANNRSGAWSPAIVISENQNVEQRNCDIAISRDGHVHVAYQKKTGKSSSDIFYAESPDSGKTWRAPVNVSNTPGRAYEPSIAVDANSGVHFAWIDSRWSNILQTTYASRAANGVYSPPVKVGGNTFERSIELTTTGSGASVQVHLVYMGRKAGSNSQTDYDIYYVSGVGTSFNKPVNLSRDGGTWSLEPTIVSDGGSNLFVAWDTDANYHDVVFARSNNGGASWTKPVNVAPRSTPALTPELSYGLLGGVPQAHLAWSEGEAGRRAVLYLSYNPATNSFGASTESASDNGTLSVDIAASQVTNEVAVSYRNKSLKARISTKGVGAYIGAGVSFEGTSPFTTPNLTVKLSDPQGDPVQMRYAFDRMPDERDAWQPFQASFGVTVPDATSCARTFNIQLRAADGRSSLVVSRDLVVDSSVQALIAAENPSLALLGGNADYTRSGAVRVRVASQGECSGLRKLYLGDSAEPLPISDDRFDQELTLLNGDQEGPQALALKVEDGLGNQLPFAKTLIVDHTQPQLTSGTMSIAAPAGGLPTINAALVFSGVSVTDNLYPGGRWGALIANMPVEPGVEADSGSPMLSWYPVQIQQAGDSFVIKGWSVLRGLASGADYRSFGGKSVTVLVRFIDGAGNASEQTLSATVQLASDLRLADSYLPVIAR